MTVLELITGRLLRRLAGSVPVMTGLEAVNEAIGVIGRELVRRKSDLTRQEISLDYSLGATNQSLPDGFMGFVDHPVLSDGTPLKAVIDAETIIALSAVTGTPEYYRVVGSGLYLYPLPDASVTVKGFVTVLPVLEMADDLPWLDLFNDLIASAALQLSQQGLALLASPPFLAMIDAGVSSVLIPRKNPLPVSRPIHYF